MRVVCIWFLKPTPVHRVAEACLRFSPQICLRKDQAIFIEIGKCKRIYSEASFEARLKVILRKLGTPAQLGFGSDIADSLLIAKYQTDNIDKLPLTALLDLADPYQKDPILQKYVAKMIQAFRDLGVQNLAEFKNVPTRELATRFGSVGIICKQRLLAETPIPWVYWQPEPIISEKFDFPFFEFYGELEPLLFQLKKQLDQIFQRLWARALKAQKINVKIFCEKNSQNPHPVRSFDFEFLFPQSNTKGALNVIKERLSRDFQKNPIVTPIEGLETTVVTTVKGSEGQKNLLHNREEVSEQIHSLLNHLSEAHGAENIFQAELTEDRLPEKSWQRSQGQAHQLTKNKVDILEHIPLRPTHLIHPEKILISGDFVVIRKRTFRIVNMSKNVERLTGGWLENETKFQNSYDRNYFQIELDTGALLSIFQKPNQEYFLQGYYG